MMMTIYVKTRWMLLLDQPEDANQQNLAVAQKDAVDSVSASGQLLFNGDHLLLYWLWEVLQVQLLVLQVVA